MNIETEPLVITLVLGLFLEATLFTNLITRFMTPLLLNAWFLVSIITLCVGLVMYRKMYY